MTGLAIFFFLFGIVLIAPHLDIKAANKYAAISLLAGLVFWGIEIAIS